ncbi:MAG: RnfABCDGE type electron transport complex subunit D [Desulfobacterales bacterium]|jgi:electron transport complex protein RnfD|nr:RnfABCDGE type electron transport complex subunit D [Desulfobacterales bacterium]
MSATPKLTVSYAPFWHNGSRISKKSCNIFMASLLAVVPGVYQYGVPALGVVALSVGSAMMWEIIMNILTRRPISIGDGNAAVIGMIFAMLLPATAPWWIVVIGTCIAIVIGKHIYGGIGGNPFNPVMLAIAILMLSWGKILDFNAALASYAFNFNAVYPLTLMKSFGASAVGGISLKDLLMGRQIGGIGATCGIGLIAGGIYLMLRGYIRWEIALSFLAGVGVTALCFNKVNPVYAGPGIHLLTGYTLVGAFYLITEDSSSPVNFIPMMIYGAGAGILTVLIRNIGAHVDGVVFAILIANLINPLVDKIRPKTIGEVITHA